MVYTIKINGKIKKEYQYTKTLTGLKTIERKIYSFDHAVEIAENYFNKKPNSIIEVFDLNNSLVYSIRSKNLFDL